MADKKKVQKQKNLSTSPAAIQKRKYGYTCLTLRFADQEHHQLVRDAAQAAKEKINSWLIRVTLAAARKELKDHISPSV